MKAGAEEAGEPPKDDAPKIAVKQRGISILDFIMRIVAVIGSLGSAIAMGTTNESLPFFTQSIRFRAEYNDLPTFTFFMVANSIVTAYLILSLALSIFHIVKSGARVTRTVLIIFDTVISQTIQD